MTTKCTKCKQKIANDYANNYDKASSPCQKDKSDKCNNHCSCSNNHMLEECCKTKNYKP